MIRLAVEQKPSQRPRTAAVVGARGYAGLELVRLLLKSPTVELTHAFATKPFKLSDDLFAAHPGVERVTCLTDDKILDNPVDVIFLATPTEVSADLAKALLDRSDSVIIDLSGAFRFSPELAEYGLAPFCGPWKNDCRLIANPGCYATAINLALIPLLKHGVIETQGLVIDAKSGTTGAGRKANEAQLFAEVDEECLPYRVGEHQHLPEITQAARRFAGATIDPHMVTHLLPVKRGITAAIFANLRAPQAGLAAVQKAYDLEYKNYPLVRHGPNLSRLTRLGHVVRTPYAHISYVLRGEKLYVFSVIDNLLKGAASQAVENLNRFCDRPLTFSLIEEG